MFGLFRRKAKKVESELASLGNKFDDLVEILAKPHDNDPTSGHIPSDIFERIESLERRFERLHADCLKYLQRGAKAEQRANQLREEAEFEEEAPQLPLTQPVANEEQADNDSDLEWAASQISQRGEVPIFG